MLLSILGMQYNFLIIVHVSCSFTKNTKNARLQGYIFSRSMPKD